MTRLKQRIARNLRMAREATGLTQQTLAEKARVSVGTVARYEQGRTTNPRDDEFERIAAAVGKTTDELRGILDDLSDEIGDDEPSDAFRAELARRYGPENADFVDEVVSRSRSLVLSTSFIVARRP